MKRTIITTVGTSLLTNTSKELAKNQQSNEKQLLNFIRHSSDQKASAETNS